LHANNAQHRAIMGDLRVSTDQQTLANLRRELTAAAERHGWRVVAEFFDAGISGSKGRISAQPMTGRCRGQRMVAAWSVDRLSRSLGGFPGRNPRQKN
jgi:DNA invertase Pin-like site-specific DNA recombinase